jgi:hypothetical protein
LLGGAAVAGNESGAGDSMLSLVTVAEKADIKVWSFVKLQGHVERYSLYSHAHLLISVSMQSQAGI